jgi:glucose/mannose transport system substrate-binding protein
MARVAWWRVGVAVVLSVPFGCGGDPVTINDVVEIDTVSYTVDEAAAFQAVLQGFVSVHQDLVVDLSYGRADQIAFEQAMTDGRPPDVFQSRAGHDVLRWATGSQGLLTPLDNVAADLGYATKIPAGVLGALSTGGHLYGVPFTIERDNTLYCNKRIFDAQGLTVPRTLAEFVAVSEVLKAKGIIPLAVGSARPWSIGMIAWPWLLVEQAGAGYYSDFFDGKKDPADPEIAATLGKLAAVLGYSNYRVKSAAVAGALAANPTAPDPEDPTTLYWSGAVDLVIAGKAAMTIAGDFAKSYFERRGRTPDIDFGEIAAPGTAGTFVFYGTAFALPKAALHPVLAGELLKVLGSADAQATFNAVSGTIPALRDADRTGFDAMDRRRMDDLAAATATVKVFDTFAARDAIDAFDEPLRAFAENGNVDAAVAAMKKAYAAIKSP